MPRLRGMTNTPHVTVVTAQELGVEQDDLMGAVLALRHDVRHRQHVGWLSHVTLGRGSLAPRSPRSSRR